MPDRDIVRRDNSTQNASSPQGVNYLLAIAINDYLHCTKLNNAVHDAEAFIEVMTSRYNFEATNVTFIKDAAATKRNIELAFVHFIKTVTPHDNFIVYFSGHGRHDKELGGNWVPVDAGKTDDDWPDYLSNDTIQSYLSKIKSFHTFLIADSCFFDSLFIDKSREKFSGDRRDNEPSRWGLTSGKKEIVSDGLPGQHSPFATALLDVLRKADQPPGVMHICDLVLEKVAANAKQTPMGSPLQVPGHQGGQLVFYFQKDEEREWRELSSSAEGCRVYLTRFPGGKYRSLAEEIIAKDQEIKAWQLAKAAGVKYALLDFERDFPNSELVRSGELNQLLDSLDEEELWKEATRSNTVSAYRAYLNRSVKKKYSLDATEAINAISEKERETLAWEQAKQLNTIAAFEAYLRDYPQGIYVVEANRVLEQIRGNLLKQQPVVPSNKENVNPEPVLPIAAVEKVSPKRTESAPNSNVGRVALSIVGLMLVLFLGYRVIRYFSGEDVVTKNPSIALIPKENNPTDSSLVLIPGGKFQMGSMEGDADEKPIHSITVSSFYLSKYEVTVAEYKKFMDENTAYQTDADKDDGSYIWDGKGRTKKAGVNWKYDPEGKIRPLSEYNHPVVHVSWNDAVKYAAWLSQKTGRSYRLPREAEWEYAAGNGSKHNKYSWGNGDPSGKYGDNVADETGARKFNWTKSAENIFVGYNDGFSTTAPVGSFYANELGLYDMGGNVCEWCQDGYESDYYAKSPTVNPKGADKSSYRIVRGGSWINFPVHVRVAVRSGSTPDRRGGIVGFRLARQQ